MKLILIAITVFFTLQSYGQNIVQPEVSFNFLYNQTKGTISDVEVRMDVDWSDLSKSEIVGVAKVKNLTTGNGKRDKHLKSEDFFNAEEFPTMEFVCRLMEKNGDRYYAKGDLTIKGVTKTVDFIVVINEDSLVWLATIDTTQFGIKVKKGEGKNKVDIRVEVPNSNL